MPHLSRSSGGRLLRRSIADKHLSLCSSLCNDPGFALRGCCTARILIYVRTLEGAVVGDTLLYKNRCVQVETACLDDVDDLLIVDSLTHFDFQVMAGGCLDGSCPACCISCQKHDGTWCCYSPESWIELVVTADVNNENLADPCNAFFATFLGRTLHLPFLSTSGSNPRVISYALSITNADHSCGGSVEFTLLCGGPSGVVGTWSMSWFAGSEGSNGLRGADGTATTFSRDSCCTMSLTGGFLGIIGQLPDPTLHHMSGVNVTAMVMNNNCCNASDDSVPDCEDLGEQNCDTGDCEDLP